MLARLRRVWSDLPRLAREAVLAVIGLLLGFVAVPLAVWAAGNRILGPYVHGTNPHAGPMALLGDFYAGLGNGWLTFWIVALGPLALISLMRAAWVLIVPRGAPPASGATPQPKIPPAANKSNGGPRRRIEPTVSRDRL